MNEGRRPAAEGEFMSHVGESLDIYKILGWMEPTSFCQARRRSPSSQTRKQNQNKSKLPWGMKISIEIWSIKVSQGHAHLKAKFPFKKEIGMTVDEPYVPTPSFRTHTQECSAVQRFETSFLASTITTNVIKTSLNVKRKKNHLEITVDKIP